MATFTRHKDSPGQDEARGKGFCYTCQVCGDEILSDSIEELEQTAKAEGWKFLTDAPTGWAWICPKH